MYFLYNMRTPPPPAYSGPTTRIRHEGLAWFSVPPPRQGYGTAEVVSFFFVRHLLEFVHCPRPPCKGIAVCARRGGQIEPVMSSWIVQNVKILSLGCLIAQNCALVLTMHHSLTAQGPRYISSTAVALMEVSGQQCTSGEVGRGNQSRCVQMSLKRAR